MKDEMDNVLAVARYIVSKKGKMGWFSLHKWLFLCYSYIYVMCNYKVFNYKFHAWANGPALPALYKLHKGNFKHVTVGWFKGKKVSRMNKVVANIIDQVLKSYAIHYDADEWGWEKSQFFHYESTKHFDNGYSIEPPWRKTREGMDIMERGNKPIKDIDIMAYYSTKITGGENDKSKPDKA